MLRTKKLIFEDRGFFVLTNYITERLIWTTKILSKLKFFPKLCLVKLRSAATGKGRVLPGGYYGCEAPGRGVTIGEPAQARRTA